MKKRTSFYAVHIKGLILGLIALVSFPGLSHAWPSVDTVFYLQFFDGSTGEPYVNFPLYYCGQPNAPAPEDKYKWYSDDLFVALSPTTTTGTWTLQSWGGNYGDGGSSESPEGYWTMYPAYYAMIWGSGGGPRHSEIQPQPHEANTKEPINIINGAVLYDKTDVEISCPGLPLSFTRQYNSQFSYVGPLGSHWTHTYNWFLLATNVVDLPVTNTYQVMQTGDGERLWFLQISSNCYSSPFGSVWTLENTSSNTFIALSPSGESFGFDSNGVMSEITLGFGQSLTFAYSNAYPNQRLASVTNWNQQSLQFQYDVSNRLVGITTPSTNLSVSFGYTGNGDLANAVTHAGPNLFSNAYSYVCMTGGWHCLTQIVNAAGTRFAYGYSTNVPTRGGPWGTSMTMTNDWYSHEVSHSTSTPDQTAVTYRRGNTNQTVNYQFNRTIQRINTISGPGGTGDQSAFTYDALGYLLSTTVSYNPLGIYSSTVLVRDARHNVASMAMGYCAVPTNTYSCTWNTNLDTLSSLTDPEGHLAEWDYTNCLVKTERLFPATNQPVETHYSYTSHGVLASVTNANGHWISYQSDACGNPTQSISQAGTTNWMTWDILNHLTEMLLPSHQNDTNDPPNMIPRVISFNPNELGWVRQITYPDSTYETFDFDAIGNVTNHVDVAGRATAFTWLPTRKLASTTRYLTSGGSNQTVAIGLAYDQQMNVVDVKDELGRGVESYQLDLQDRPVTVTNGENQVMTLFWGLKDMVSQIVRFDVSTNTFAYDEGARVKQITYPDDALSFAYYKNRLPMTSSNRWGVISNVYDGANRLTSQTQPVPYGNVAYGYYPAGQVSNVVSVAGTNTYARDAGDRLQKLSASTPNRHDSLTYTYDPITGMMTGVSYSNGIHCSNSYDLMDRLTGISWTDSSNRVLRSRSYSYTPAGMISNITYETGEKAIYSYDSLDRLTREKHIDYYGQVISDEKYDYDLAGNRMKKTILDGGGDDLVTVNYSLPSGNKLGSWTVAETNLATRFPVVGGSDDPIGVRIRYGQFWVSNSPSAYFTPYVANTTNFYAFDMTCNMGTQYIYAAIPDLAGNTSFITNRFYPTCLTNGTYQYSAAGCLTNRLYSGKDYTERLGLTWNGQYQLTAASTNGVAAEQYGYDGAGRRIFIIEGGVTNWMVYDGNQVVAEVDNSGNLKKTYVYEGLDRAVSLTTFGATTNTYYFLRDHLGSTMALTDGSGNIVESYRYDAWGRVLAVYNAAGSQIEESAVGNRILWQGREYSFKTALYYFRARWYDPITGRWLSNDPIGISGGLNQYVFCANNPVNFRDPMGLAANTISLNMPGIGSSDYEISYYGPGGINGVRGVGPGDYARGAAVAGVYGGAATIAVGATVGAAVYATPYAIAGGAVLVTQGQRAVAGIQNAYYSLLASSPGSLILEYPQSASRNWAQWLAPIGEKGVELAARMGTRPSLLERYRTARSWFDQSEKSSGSNCGK